MTGDPTAAANTAEQSGSNDCATIRPCYSEVGDPTAALASGPVNSSTDPTV